MYVSLKHVVVLVSILITSIVLILIHPHENIEDWGLITGLSGAVGYLFEKVWVAFSAVKLPPTPNSASGVSVVAQKHEDEEYYKIVDERSQPIKRKK